MEYGEFVDRKEAKIILGIKSDTTMGKYESEGIIIVYRPLSNRLRYKVSELLDLQNKG